MLPTKDVNEIKLVFQSWNPTNKSRTYKNVNVENATLANNYAFGQALAALSDWPLDQVILSSDQEIIDLP